MTELKKRLCLPAFFLLVWSNKGSFFWKMFKNIRECWSKFITSKQTLEFIFIYHIILIDTK